MMLFRKFAILLLLAYAVAANAQRCGAQCSKPETLIGLSEQTLIALVPDLQRIAKPVLGPGNGRGKWLMPVFYFATQPFVATIYIKSGHVNRVEYLSTATKLECSQRTPFDLALAELGLTYGDSKVAGTFESNGKAIESVAFNSQSMNVALQLSTSPEECSTRVIFKTRDIKEASEL